MIRRMIVLPIILAVMSSVPPSRAELQSHRVCRECHSDIFELWKNSLHATAYTNATFQAAFMKLLLERGRATAKECLRCHAPAAYLENEIGGHSINLAGGVTCSFCHSISAVRGGDIDTCYVLDTSNAVYGPYKPSNVSAHDIQYSPLHLAAEMCAGCHEHTNDNGARVLETYSEWSASPYAKQEVYCQNCHMPIMYELDVADNLNVTDYYVTAHEFQGGHSGINLSHAVHLETSAQRDGRVLKVEVRVTNAESGHKLPTGVPVRKLVLTVTMKSEDGIRVASARKVYRKTLQDKYGAIIENAPDMFLNATSVYTDNRIEPKETRIEHFSFEIPKWASRFKLETVLNYEYTRPILSEELVSVQMARNVLRSHSIK